MKLIILCSLLVATVASNDDREFAIIQASCRRICAIKYSSSQQCLALCSLSRACSRSNCELFCSPSDSLRRDTCRSFLTTPSCQQSCTSETRVNVTEPLPDTASIHVRVELEADIVSHVVLLNQVSCPGISDHLTHDHSFLNSVNFTGLYPWCQYEIELIQLTEQSCCTSESLWTGSPSFDPAKAAASTKLDDGLYLSDMEFYTYPLPEHWINDNVTGEVDANKIPIFLYHAGYHWPDSNVTWNLFNQQPLNKNLGFDHIRVMGVGGLDFKECDGNTSVATKFNCIRKGFGKGYLFNISSDHTARSEGGSTVYYIRSGDLQTLILRVKPRITCHFFPRPHRNLTLDCGEKNMTANTVVVPYKFQSSTKETASIRMCMKSEEGSLSVAHNFKSACCHGKNTLSCICSEGRCDMGSLVLELNRTYILYLQIEPPNVKCKTTRPCDGSYQRIVTNALAECSGPSPSLPSFVIPTTVGIILFLIAAIVGVLLWRRFRNGSTSKKPVVEVPWDDEGLGGELPRDVISKESYLDKGNFGFILGGKLKVRLRDKDELTKQYDVALKILKTKVDRIGSEETDAEENLKDAKKAMKAEIHIMKQIQGSGREINDNVLRMFGYVVDAPPYILVLELCVTNLTRYLRRLRIQIENKTLSPDEVQIGTVLSLDDHKNSISHPNNTDSARARTDSARARVDSARARVDSARGENEPRRESGLKRAGGQRSRDTRESKDGMSQESTLISGSENGISLVPKRPRVMSRGGGLNVSSYNDSKHGKMARQGPSIERFKDTILTTNDLLTFCRQVSSGMDFLHSIELIHRDLAADNVLLKEESDGRLTVKICDFGQSRILYDGKYVCSGDSVTDRQRMFRLRWTAPEIKTDPKKWSKYSDVWSFGVVVWEIFTLGGVPYPGWPDHHVLDNLLAGLRMKQPPCCNDQVWEIALRCWAPNPETRGEFNDIKLELDRIMCEDRDKELGVKPSDYTFCDAPIEDDTTADATIDHNNVNIMDTDVKEGPLELDDLKEFEPDQCTVVENKVTNPAVQTDGRSVADEVQPHNNGGARGVQPHNNSGAMGVQPHHNNGARGVQPHNNGGARGVQPHHNGGARVVVDVVSETVRIDPDDIAAF